jgi:hypothetical protein
MAGSIWDWSQTAASNDDADGDINWVEGQPARTVNNSARVMMQRVAQFTSDLSAKTATTGTGGTYALTTASPFTAYADGIVVGFTANHVNPGAATLNCNTIGAKPIYAAGSVLVGGEIKAGGAYILSYDTALNSAAGGWHLVSVNRRHGTYVTDFGAVGDGVTNDSAAILAADAAGGRMVIEDGEFTYQSDQNPTFADGVEILNATVDGQYFDDVFSVDAEGRFIGLQHNHLQYDEASLGNNIAVTHGKIVAPPLSKVTAQYGVDIVAHWYNDFGLEYTRAADGAVGSLTWYYWDWNHTDASAYTWSGAAWVSAVGSGYDTSRHPLLGWYRGDDANVLDWQCYWLREYGVTAVSLVSANTVDIDTSTWDDPEDGNYWIYQLFTAVPNFKGLKYVLWPMADYGATSSDVTTNWTDIISNIYLQYGNFYAIEKNGELFPVMFVWEADALRGSFDSFVGATNLKAFFIDMSDLFKAAGYGGVCLFARNATTDALLDYGYMEQNGVIYIPAEYAGITGATPGSTYSDLVDDFVAPTTRAIVNVTTSYESHHPHPSGWTTTGSTPALFEKALHKAVSAVRNSRVLPKIVTVYNVAEWAEGGPGLQPNVRDGFGYLQAVKNVVQAQNRSVPSLPYSKQFVKTVKIVPSHDVVFVFSDFSDTLNTATHQPTIEPGYDGQKIRLVVYPGIGSYSLTLHDDGTVAGTDLFLRSTSITLDPYESLELQYFTDKGGWVEIGRST